MTVVDNGSWSSFQRFPDCDQIFHVQAALRWDIAREEEKAKQAEQRKDRRWSFLRVCLRLL